MYRWLGGVGYAAVIVAVPARAQQPAVAFVNVSVAPMDSERVLVGQTVLVRDGRIAAIGPAGRVNVPPDAVQVDGQGKYLMPGLADMHIHIFEGGSPASLLNEDVLLTLLANGITTVRDMHSGGRFQAPGGYGSDTLALRVKKDLANGRLVGPHVYTAGDPAHGGEGESSVRESVVALHTDGHDFVKVNDGWEEEEYDAIQAVADSLGLRIVGHVPPNFGGIQGVLKARWASIEHLMGYVEAVRTQDGLDQAKLRELAAATQRAGVWNCPTLSYWEAVTPERLTFYLPVVKALHDAGAGLLSGTDEVDPWRILTKYSLQPELALLSRAGLTPYQVLETGTRNVARFMRIEDSAGTVAVGKRADLVLLTANPLEDVRHTAAPVGVMIGGRWLLRTELEQRLQALAAGRKTNR